LTRRRFLQGTAGLAAASALPPLLGRAHAATPPATGKKLNVLMIAVDDLRPDLGCFGVEHVHSPNIDRLAARGLVFNRAYCQQAVCSPSRTSLMTGKRPDTTRIYNLDDHFRDTLPDTVTLTQHFINHGYAAVGMGKIYHGSLNDDRSWSSWRRHRGKQWADPDTEAHLAARRKEGREQGLKGRKLHNYARGPATESADVADGVYHDGVMTEMAVETLAGLKDEGKPFFLATGFVKPHLPFCAPKKYWNLYKRGDIALPANDRQPDGAPDLAMHNFGELRSYSDIPREGRLTDDKARELIHGYYACVSYIDALVGRLLDTLDELGLADSTAIALWGDHGWHLREQGLWCKHSNFENATRSPLIVSVPGMAGAGKTTDALSEFVDVYPTLAEAAGLPVPDGLEGTSALPLLDRPDTPWKSAAFSQFPRRKTMGYSMRTDRYRYTRWQANKDPDQRVAAELYDHANDPRETVNLADQPGHAETIAQLDKQLAAGWRAALPA